MYTMKTIFFILLIGVLIISNVFLVSAALEIEFNNDDLPKVVMGVEEAITTFRNNTAFVNSSNFWDNLNVPTDILNSEFWYNHTLHVFNLYNSTWDNRNLIGSNTYNATYANYAYNQSEATFEMYNSTWDNRGLINNSWTQNYADTIYIPYTGATNDVNLGSNDFWARDINATDDLFVNDDAKIGDNLDVFGDLGIVGTSLFENDMQLQTWADAILEIETFNVTQSAQLRLLADGVNDLYIYTYGSNATGSYYGFPKNQSSYVDARGARLIIGTFDDSPMYLASSRNARIELDINGNFVPVDDDDIDLGNITQRWQDLYLTGEEDFGLHFVEDDGIMGNLSMDDDGNLLWNNVIVNITGGNTTFSETYADNLYAGIEWNYNQSLATFTMWNSSWDNRGLILNHTLLTFNQYNSTWDNSYMNKWNYNQTLATFNL